MRVYALFLGLVVLTSCAGVEEFLDIVPPRVVSVTPGEGMRNVSQNTEVIIRFSASMDKALTEKSFTLSTGEGAYINGAVIWDSNAVFRFVPQTPLTQSVSYRIKILADAEDVDGNNLEREYSSVFYIGNDVIEPTVAAILPVNGAIGVLPGTEITVEFSEAMNRDSVVGGVTLSPAVNCTWRWEGTRYILTPLTALQYGKTYTVSVATTVGDSAGNLLDDTVTSRFTVGDDFVKPAVSLVAQPDGVGWTDLSLNTGRSRFGDISISFSETIAMEDIADAIRLTPGAAFIHRLSGGGGVPTVVTLEFVAPLDCEKEYKLSINASGIKDIQNNPLDRDYVYRFTTDGADSTHLSIDVIAFDDVGLGSTTIWNPDAIEAIRISVDPNPPVRPNPRCSKVRIHFTRQVDVATVDLDVESALAGGSIPSIANASWTDVAIVGGKPYAQTLVFDIELVTTSLSASIFKITVKGGDDGAIDIAGNYLKESFAQLVILTN